MKKLLVLIALSVFINTTAQITLNHVTKVNAFLAKFTSHGYKYVQVIGTSSVNIYNLNHTLYNSFAVPAPYNNNLCLSSTNRWIYYVTDNLFDTDNGFEYAVVTGATSCAAIVNVTIFNDNGTIIMSKDSAGFSGSSAVNYSAVYNFDAIYSDGVSTKMNIGYVNIPGYSQKRIEVYDLPGSLPCSSCTSGLITGLTSTNETPTSSAEFYPNPASDQLKLKYRLPEGAHQAEMKIYDTQGKLVDEFKVTDAFDFIYLPTNFNNGLYLYSLLVDGKVVKTEKIVLNK